MKRYEELNLEVLAVDASDIISTSVVIKGETGSGTSWGDIGSGTIKE